MLGYYEFTTIFSRRIFNIFIECRISSTTAHWQTPLTGYLYAFNDITTRGFTGHEQVDSMGIVHMNGRIYDAKLGRFLQADPIVLNCMLVCTTFAFLCDPLQVKK